MACHSCQVWNVHEESWGHIVYNNLNLKEYVSVIEIFFQYGFVRPNNKNTVQTIKKYIYHSLYFVRKRECVMHTKIFELPSQVAIM